MYTETPKFTEISLSVADYVDATDSYSVEQAFADCESDVDKARQTFNAEFPGRTVVSIEFNEFDSSNWTHASAYFSVKYTGEDCDYD